MSNPFVSVLVCNHLIENQKYLDVCLRSIMKQKGISFEVWCLSDAQEPPRVPQGVKLIHDKSLSSSGIKTAYYVKNLIHQEAKCLMFVCDDTMMTKNSMHNMARTAMMRNAYVGPLCNGEIHSQFLSDFITYDKDGKDPIKIPVELDLEDLKGREDGLMDKIFVPTLGFTDSNHQEAMPVVRNWLPGFLFCAPKDTYLDVGPVDPRLSARFDDVDLSFRAQRKGYATLTEMSAFCVHFANKSLTKSTNQEAYLAASRWFHAKQKEVTEL